MVDDIFNLVNDGDIDLITNNNLVTESMTFEDIPFMRTIAGRKIDLPVGQPTGKGNIAYLYTHDTNESYENMKSNITHFRNSKRYKYYFYNPIYSEKVYTKIIRIREVDKQKQLYNKIVKELHLTCKKRLITSETDNRNMYYDLSKYLEIFTNVCYKLQPRVYISLFWDYFYKIVSQPVVGYNHKFILVNLKNYKLLKNDLRQNLGNPLYLIYYTLYKYPALLEKINFDFYFYNNKKVLKLNPSKMDAKKGYKHLKIEMDKITRGLISKEIVQTVTSEEEINKSDTEATITSNIITSVTPMNVKVNTISTNEQLKAIAKPTETDKKIEAVTKKNVEKAKKAVEKINNTSTQRSHQDMLSNTPEESNNVKERKKQQEEDIVSKSAENKAKQEIDDDRELLHQIYYQNKGSGETQKSKASTARDRMLQKKQKDIKVGGITIDKLEKINAEEIPIETKDVSKNVRTTNKNMTEIKFANIDKEYTDKLMKKDIISDVLALNNKSIPMYILKIDVKDTSDELNYKDTYTIYFEDANRKRHTVKVDIPKFIDGRFLYIGGNKKIIKHQSFLLPIVKISPDSVQIVTNYSKMTVYRKDNKSTGGVERLLSLIKKDPELKKYFKVGAAYPNNKNSLTTLEYDRISKEYTEFSNNGTHIYFDQPKANALYEKSIKQAKDNNKGIPDGKIFIGLDKGKVCFIDANTQVDENGRNIVDIILEALPPKYKEKYGSVPVPKGLVYATVRIMSQNFPVGMLMGLWIGMSKLLNKLKIKYRLVEKGKSLGPIASNEYTIQFSDCTMIYTCDVPCSLIMNSISRFTTKNYSFAEFDERTPYLDCVRKIYGKAIIENALMNFYEFFMDPITIEICESTNLPTNIIDVLIYSVNLLADTQSQNELNQNLSRIRCNEIIPGILYDKLAKNYVAYRTSNGRKKFNVPQDCVIKELLGLKTVEDYSTLNPTLEMQQIHAVSNKGFRGINLDDYYTIERRAYDPTMMGVLSPSGSPDGNIGVNKTLTLEPKITNLRGFIEDDHEHLDKLEDVNLFGPGELTMPLAATIDDPNRLGHANKQSSHVIPVANSAPVLISNGMEEVARFHVTSNFVINADEDGKIVDYDEKANIMIAQYKSGKCRAIDLSPNIVKNAGGGFYLSNKLITNLKVGDTFKKNDVLAYHKDFFTNDKYNNCRMNMGTLTKIAIMSTYNTYEDSTFITHKLSRDCATEMVFCKSVVVGKNSNVYNIVKKGQEIVVGDPLISFDTSYDDDSVNALLSKLSDENKNSIMDNARNDVKSKYSGVIEDIKIYPTIDLDEMSPTLKHIVSTYYRSVDRRKKFLDKYDPESANSVVKCGVLVNTPTHKVQPNKFGVIKGEHVEDGVLIEFYIKHMEPLEVGSKIANFTALKNTIGEILPEGYEPYSEYRPDEEIGTFVASNSILNRMTPSILLTALGNKCIIELKRHLKDIYNPEKPQTFDRKKMENLIYSFFDAMDKGGSNTKKYHALFDPMTNTQFKKYFDGLFADEKAYLILDIVDYEHTITMDQIQKAANVLKIPLYETVYMPHLTMDKEKVVSTKAPVPVGYINEKRTQQTILKKNGISTDIAKRSSLTNQVTGKDKNGRESDLENTMLISLGMKNTLKELNGPRADDSVMKQEMLKDIALNGYTRLADMDDEIENKTTLNTVNTYILGMSINSDLVTKGLMLPKTIKEEL